MSSTFAFEPRRAIRHLRAADPALGELIATVGPFRMEQQAAPSTFIALGEAIVYQQLNGKAASAIYRRVEALFGPPGPTPEQLLALSDEQLRGAGLSGAKARALRDLAERTLSGDVPTLEEAETMTDAEIVQRLSTVRGVGRWTAEMFLIFRLGRPDVLPSGDYGLRRGFSIVFGTGSVPTPRQVEERGEKWRPYRTVASWYLWRAAETTTL